MSEPDAIPPHMSSAELRRRGYEAVDLIADYLEQLERGVADGGWPVQSRAVPGEILEALPASPPEAPGAGDPAAWFAGVQRDMREIILPGLTHWQSPRFFGYFPCNASGPATLAEILCAGLNANGFLWATGPAITELEMRMMDWMAEALGLPAGFRFGSEGEPARGGGVIQGTASESTLVAMLAGRQRAMAAMGQGADASRLTVYASEEAHSSVLKAAMVAGLAAGPEDRSRVRMIPVDEVFAMDAEALRAAFEADRAAGLVPAYVCATVGTTGSTAVDPVVAIADVLDADAQKHGGAKAWLHVDAAHAAAACVAPEFRWLLRGVERADSLCFNPHKWLLTTFDCDCFWTQDRAALNQALSVTPEYLRNVHSESGAVVDYRDWQIPLGRRFRALKLWLVMTWYGLEGLRAHVRQGVRLAEQFEQWVGADERFEVTAPRVLNLVCFRLALREGEGGAPEACDRRNRMLLDAVNASGRALLTHTTLPRGGRRDFTLRMAIGGTLTEERHVRETWELIQGLAAPAPLSRGTRDQIESMAFFGVRPGEDRQFAIEEFGEPQDYGGNKSAEWLKWGAIEVHIVRETSKILGIQFPWLIVARYSGDARIDQLALELAVCTQEDLKNAFGDKVKLDEKWTDEHATYYNIDGPAYDADPNRFPRISFIFDEEGHLEKVGLWDQHRQPQSRKKRR